MLHKRISAYLSISTFGNGLDYLFQVKTVWNINFNSNTVIKAYWKQKGCLVALLVGQQITYDLKSSKEKLHLSTVYNRNENRIIQALD